MKKKLLSLLLIASLLPVTACGSSGNDTSKKAETAEGEDISFDNADLKSSADADFTITDFDFDLSETVSYGDPAIGFTYKNNTKDTVVTQFTLTCKIKEDATDEELQGIKDYVDSFVEEYKSYGEENLDKDDKALLKQYEEDKESFYKMFIKNRGEEVFYCYDKVKPGKTSETETTSTDYVVENWDVFEPYTAEIEYEKDGDTYQYTYNFKEKTEAVEKF